MIRIVTEHPIATPISSGPAESRLVEACSGSVVVVGDAEVGAEIAATNSAEPATAEPSGHNSRGSHATQLEPPYVLECQPLAHGMQASLPTVAW
jgi:hypothetical protein